MSYKILTITPFDKRVKELSKKYPSLKKDISELVNSLQENPKQGISLGLNCYKIRIAITSKGKGKSGGGRLITHVVFKNSILYFLTIYDKSERAAITDKEIKDLLKYIPK